MTSKTKELLIMRKADLEAQLKGYQEILDELKEVNLALAALTPRTECTGCYAGCDFCRTGPRYR